MGVKLVVVLVLMALTSCQRGSEAAPEPQWSSIVNFGKNILHGGAALVRNGTAFLMGRGGGGGGGGAASSANASNQTHQTSARQRAPIRQFSLNPLQHFNIPEPENISEIAEALRYVTSRTANVWGILPYGYNGSFAVAVQHGLLLLSEEVSKQVGDLNQKYERLQREAGQPYSGPAMTQMDLEQFILGMYEAFNEIIEGLEELFQTDDPYLNPTELVISKLLQKSVISSSRLTDCAAQMVLLYTRSRNPNCFNQLNAAVAQIVGEMPYLAYEVKNMYERVVRFGREGKEMLPLQSEPQSIVNGRTSSIGSARVFDDVSTFLKTLQPIGHEARNECGSEVMKSATEVTIELELMSPFACTDLLDAMY